MIKIKLTADEVRKIRKALKLSQAQFAAMLELSIRAVQSWEQGWRNVPHWQIGRIKSLSEKK